MTPRASAWLPWSLGAGTAAFALYAGTSSGSVCGGDSGELGAAACTLGVAHPPGYPLYTALAHLWGQLVPLGSMATRLNGLSAAAMAVAVGLLVATVGRWTRSPWPGVAAGLTFGLAPLVSRWGGCAEVFGLHVALVAAYVLAVMNWATGHDRRWAFGAAALAGLAMAHHHTFAPLAFFSFGWLVWSTRGGGARTAIAIVAVAAAAALGTTMYLWASATGEPPVQWGDTASASGLLHHVLRRDYGTFQLAAEGASSAPGSLLVTCVERLARETWAIAPAVGGMGLLFGCTRAHLFGRSPPGLRRALVAGLAMYLAAFSSLANLDPSTPLLREVLARFWLAPLWLCALGVGWAVAAAEAWVGAGRKNAGAVMAMAVAGAMAGVAVTNRPRLSAEVERVAVALLAPLPPGTTLLTRGDLMSPPLAFATRCEGSRPDVSWLDQELLTYESSTSVAQRTYPALTVPGRRYHPTLPSGFHLADLLHANWPQHGMAIFPDIKPGDHSLDAGVALLPCGLARLAIPAAAVPAWQPWVQATLGTARRVPVPSRTDWDGAEPGSWELLALHEMWNARHNALAAILGAIMGHDGRRLVAGAVSTELQLLAEAHPSPPYDVYKNLALAWDQQQGLHPDARRNAAAALARAVELAPPAEPELPHLRHLLERLEEALPVSDGRIR